MEAMRYDAAVVGAGLGGLATARRLAGQGLTVALLDAKTDLGRAVHTTGIFVRKTLEDFDFPPDSLGPAVRRVALLAPSGRQLDLSSDHDEFRVGRMAPLYHRLLAEAVAAGAHWYPGARLCEARWTKTHGQLDLAVKRRRFSLTTRFLIGADGARSTAAPLLGLDQNRHWIVGAEEVVGGVSLDGPGRFWCLVDPEIAPGYLAWLIHDREEVHIGVGGYGHRFEPAAALHRWKAAAGRLLDLTAGQVIERRGGLIPVGGVLRHIANDRGLLVGDAAGAPSPLTAGGLDPCLRLAALAADVTTQWLKTGDRSHLGRYDGRRFRARFASRLLMRRVFSALATRALVERAFDFLETGPGRRFASHVFFGRGSFPDVGVPLTLGTEPENAR